MDRHKPTYYQEYYAKNLEKKKLASRDYNTRMKSAVFDILGRCCGDCGFNDERALQIDHVNGGGLAEKKGLKVNYYYVLIVTG